MIVLFLSFLVLFQNVLVVGCGVGVHLTLYERSAPFMPEFVKKNHRIAQAGAFFPDAFYSCAGLSEAAEDTHWPPFMKIAVDYWREKYGNKQASDSSVPISPGTDQNQQKLLNYFNPLVKSKGNTNFEEDGQKLKAFIYGMLTHQVSDVSWHSLGLYQGLMVMLANLEFDGDIDKAHSVLDTGGDMIMVRRLLNSGMDLDWLSGESWDWPVDDIIEMFSRAGYSVGSTNLAFCMYRGRAALRAELGLAKLAFSNYAKKSPILFSQLEDYYLGGTVEMTMGIRHCMESLHKWFEHGTPDDPWTLCEVFDGRSNLPPPSCVRDIKESSEDGEEVLVRGDILDSEGQFSAKSLGSESTLGRKNQQQDSQEDDNMGQTTSHEDPVILTTGMTESMFGASIAFGDFLDDEPCVAIGAPFEADLPHHIEPKGSVYVIKESQLGEKDAGISSENSKRIKEISPGMNMKEPNYTYNEKFGAQVATLNIMDTPVLAISRPGVSRIDFFVENQAIIQLGLNSAKTKYGLPGQKLVGDSLHSADLTGDGLDDLIIGAPRNDVGYNAHQGQVYIITGESLKQIMMQTGFGRSLPFVPPQFDIKEVADVILNDPVHHSYSLFGSRISSVGDAEGNRALLVGASGAGKVYAYNGTSFRRIATLNSDVELAKQSDFGGALVTGGREDGLVAVADSAENVGSCTQCGAVYLFKFQDGEFERVHKVTIDREASSFTRFGLEGAKLRNSFFIASPHANKDRGSLWRVTVSAADDKKRKSQVKVQTLVKEGPRPWSNGFGGVVAAKELNSKEDLVVVGMPHYGSNDNRLQGAAAVYQFEH